MESCALAAIDPGAGAADAAAEDTGARCACVTPSQSLPPPLSPQSRFAPCGTRCSLPDYPSTHTHHILSHHRHHNTRHTISSILWILHSFLYNSVAPAGFRLWLVYVLLDLFGNCDVRLGRR